MISANDCQTVQLQLPSQSTSTVSSSRYIEIERFDINSVNFLDQSTFMTNNSLTSDNKMKDNVYVMQDQNYNINASFCVSGTVSTNKVSYIPAYGFYGKTLNSEDFLNRRHQWKSNKGNINTYASDSKHAQNGVQGNGNRFRDNNANNFKTNGCENNLNGRSNTFCNSHFSNRHNNTNGLNKMKQYSHNKKLYRHNNNNINNNHIDDIHKCAFGLMERFKSMAKLFRINPTLPFCNKLESSSLDQAIWNLFVSKAQTEETYMNKLELWQKAYIHIGKLYVRFALFMVGSTMSGLATQNSDIDMCLLLRSIAVDPRHEAVNYLEEIRKSLINCGFVESVDLIQAKVPILKFVGLENGFTVDLNYNNSVGIRNTHLLYCYVQLDWRVRPLVIIVKLWAQANSINDAKHMTISSYSLALMVIHYLQCGTDPPILPCLHSMYPDKFKPDKEIYTIEVQEKIPRYNSCNEQSLGELLLGFLHYYACFDYEAYAISVRLASRVRIDECRYAVSQKNDIHQWKFLCIEEPFDLTNTARSVYDLETFRRIQCVFQNSSSVLWQTGDLNLILKTEENQR